ncbi:putative ATP-dependent RNA helicase TDRD12 [Sitophilus oryzae]|uniref:RNA helicase n=1 Tax=Sitophilus oryzae TaxID=7048 RepID=A0A6J2Y440_SITOR|nr:putative ATP-dependent RNA helicase TDRD12 [Sitophilus oryzae]
MNLMEVDIATFITPHFFFLIERNKEHRCNFLKQLSTRINDRVNVSLENVSFSIDEIVAVHHEHGLVRASIQNITEENDKQLYYCWLLDYGILTKTYRVFKLPFELQKVTPQAKQASLNNIGYSKDNLEMGATGKIKCIPSVIPSTSVLEYCLSLFSGATKLCFDIEDHYDHILIGELIIYKDNQEFKLSEELMKKGLVINDEDIFERLKYKATIYMKNNLDMIYHTTEHFSICKYKNEEVNSVKIHYTELLDLDDEVDSDEPLGNGRRRRNIFRTKDSGVKNLSLTKNGEIQLAKSNVFESDKENSSCFSISNEHTSNSKRAVDDLKNVEQISNKNDKLPNKIGETNSKSNVEILRQKLADFKMKQKLLQSKLKESEGLTSPQSDFENKISDYEDKDTSLSPFLDVTSEKSPKSNVIFLPAGMSHTYKKASEKRSHKSTKKKPVENRKSHDLDVSSTSLNNDSDCPTVEVSTNISNQEKSIVSDTPAKNYDSSMSSEKINTESFSKLEYYKLVNGCNCVDCRKVYEDDDWDSPLNFDHSIEERKIEKKSVEDVIKPPKLFKTDDDVKLSDGKQILSIEYNNMTAVQKQTAAKLLVHGDAIPNPIAQVSNLNIHPDIYGNISRLNYKLAKKIQRYAFPAITRNQHVIMINDAKSGKTMAYLPILISFIREKNERYGQLMNVSGAPFVVILCSTSKRCEKIYDLIRMILENLKSRVNLVTYPGYGNMSNIEILVTMPAVLSSLISLRAINFKRLCHFVLEDGDTMLESHQNLIYKFFDLADKVLEHRNCPKSIQLIVCAEHWTLHIENILKKLNKAPLVCIGNYLEAALYAKMNFTMKFLETSFKEQELKKMLSDVYKFTKSIVICNPEDIQDIETFLMLKGIEYIAVKDEMAQEDMQYYEGLWNNCTPGKYSVLICSDNVYNTMLTVTSASLLVHYSLPNSWSQFSRRFSCFLENITTPLNTKEKLTNICSIVFVDENCESRMNKFAKFIKKSGLEKYLPEKIKSYFDMVIVQEEHTKIERKVELCQNLNIFGKCSSVNCSKRHILNKDVDVCDVLPKNGIIKFKILTLTNTTTASIKLLEHLDLKEKRVKVYDDMNDYINEVLQRKESYHRAVKIVRNNLYLYKEDGKYYRCKLIEKEESVLVFLLDRGIYCKTDVKELCEIPEELIEVPQQCFEVYLANLIPPYEDNTFSRLSRNNSQLFLETNCSNATMKAVIKLQLADHLWLEDVCEERELHDKSLPSLGFQFTRELINQGLALQSEDPLNLLYNLCKEADIELMEYNLPKPKTNIRKAEQAKPQWAFLSCDDITEVMFSSATSPAEFYVKQTKFYKQLLDLEEYILKEIRKPFYPVPDKVEVGNCYLVKDVETENYSRALLMTVDNDNAHVFCVDYGDDIIVPVSSLKFIRNEMITKLPFQSIQCSMYGVKSIDGTWRDEATDLLYDKGFEPGTDVFRSLFVKVYSRQNNEIVQKQNSYLVAIKDGFSERHLLLSQLLIDCGFALPNGKELEDFEIPETVSQDDDEDDGDDYINEMDYNSVGENRENVPPEEDFSKYEFVAFDVEQFLIEAGCNIGVLKQYQGMTTKNDLPVIKAAPEVDYLTPNVIWYQTASNIRLTINIPDVKDCRISLLQNRAFNFSTDLNGKKYMVKLMLFEKVEKTYEYTILGSQVRITLKKSKDAEWPRLLLKAERNRKVHYDISMLKDNDERRKMLDLGFGDSSESDSDSEGYNYHICSDLDSEYDYDIANDDY